MTTGTTETLAPAGRIWTTGLIAGVIAGAINFVVYLVASSAGVPFNVAPPDVPAPPFGVAAFALSVISILIGTFVLTLMPRFSQRPISTWRTVAIVALVLSFLQPLVLLSGMGGMPVSGWDTVIVLEIMHIIAGVIAIYLLTTRARA
mgnify:CR=1 FL=1|jgi:hypothetical protein